MKDVRAWVSILAVACLAAGAGGGVLYARATAPRDAVDRTGAFSEYEALLVSTFDLSPARREALRAVLVSYEADLARIKDRHMADYMKSIEPELRERGRFYRELVRDRVLPEARRAEFDAMSLGTPVTSTP
jgi:hypothetical protein